MIKWKHIEALWDDDEVPTGTGSALALTVDFMHIAPVLLEEFVMNYRMCCPLNLRKVIVSFCLAATYSPHPMTVTVTSSASFAIISLHN